MAFLNQSFAQIRDLFASMTPAARITSALLLGVIVVSLGYLFQGYAGASEELLFNGEVLQPREADYVEAAIAEAGLTVMPRQAGRIVVPRGQKTAYLAAIADAGALPKDFDKLLEDSLDTGMFENGETKKARFKAARERQLSMVISMMDGVDDAKVMYDIREPQAFEKEQVTAMVSVLPDMGTLLEPHQMKMIRDAVAAAISGLNPTDVTILNQSTGSEFGASGSVVSAASFDDPYYQTRLAYEAKLKNNIENLLHFVQPAPQVQVSAELDPTTSAELDTVKPEGEVATIREMTDTQSSTNTQVEDRGRPGLTAQGPNRGNAEQSVARNENVTESNRADVENFVPRSRETRREVGLTPKVVRASISIPSEYLVRVWRERTPDAAADAKPDPTILEQIEEQTKTNVKAAVAQLLPKEVAENAQTNVEVTMFQSLTPAATAEPSIASEGLLWAGKNSGSLIMAALAIVSLMMLRSMVKSIPAADTNLAFKTPVIPETVSEKTSKGAAKADTATASPGGRPRLRLKKGPTLKDDLTELVKEDPDGAAAILRTWIGNAA
jgi:flagellar M-ring protein FliF